MDWFLYFKKGIPDRQRKYCSCACVPGRYLLYQTFPQEGRQARYFNVSTPSSRRENNITVVIL